MPLEGQEESESNMYNLVHQFLHQQYQHQKLQHEQLLLMQQLLQQLTQQEQQQQESQKQELQQTVQEPQLEKEVSEQTGTMLLTNKEKFMSDIYNLVQQLLLVQQKQQEVQEQQILLLQQLFQQKQQQELQQQQQQELLPKFQGSQIKNFNQRGKGGRSRARWYRRRGLPYNRNFHSSVTNITIM